MGATVVQKQLNHRGDEMPGSAETAGTGRVGEVRNQASDLLCFSHLRWDFVYQRPQHLLSRAAADRRVLYFEEPVFRLGEPWLELPEPVNGVQRVIPHLRPDLGTAAHSSTLRHLLDGLLERLKLHNWVAWYYTPMALAFSSHLRPAVTVYDCMDELSLFKGAPPELQQFEQQLLRRADLVFTGGPSLYSAKRGLHKNVHLFPSSIEQDHFSGAALHPEPAEIRQLPHPRIGFYGVIDERMDLQLVEQLADLRPDWQFVLLGPIVKIDPASRPQRPNLHWPGRREYGELPAWLAAFDVAMMPFALNDSTRFISPTKTLEYLAAGKRVVSTPIQDVREPYGHLGIVGIARSAEEFIRLCDEALAEGTPAAWQLKVRELLAATSWDRTWDLMDSCLSSCLQRSVTSGVAD